VKCVYYYNLFVGYFLITRLMLRNVRFYVFVLVLYVSFYYVYSVFLYCLFIISLYFCIAVPFLFLYKFTDNCQ